MLAGWGRVLHRDSAPLVRSDFAQNTGGGYTPNGDYPDRFRPSDRRDRLIQGRAPQLVLAREARLV
jgi:hypothetical protein